LTPKITFFLDLYKISDRLMGRMTYFIFEPTVPSLRIRRIPNFFELRTLSIKSSLKTLKSVNFSRGSEKGAKNSYGSYPTE
jgi:hypothetical protein